jgi:hypothetical protein
MKAKITAIPKLLGDSGKQNLWEITVTTKNDWAKMTFSNKDMAKKQYDQIRTQGTYGGQWLATIELKEVYASQGNANE